MAPMKPRLAWAIAVGCGVAVAVSCAFWIRANPLPSYYDEALYAIYAVIDAWAARTYGWMGALYAMWRVDPSVPPAFRLLALPFSLMAAPSLTLLRALSLAGLFAAAAIAAEGVRRAAGSAAGAMAYLFTVSLPILALATRMFGTEYPLLLAVALFVFALTSPRAGLWMTISVALGLVAKTSYAVVALPMLAAAAFVFPERRRPLAAGAVAGVVLSLWWWTHEPMRAIRFGIESGRFIRHNVGSPWRWAYEFLRCDLGFFLTAAIVVIAIAAWRRLSPLAIVCLAGALPLLVLHATSVNHNPRLIAVPAMLIALAAAASSPHLGRWQQAACIALAAIQVAVMTVPRRRGENVSYIWRGVSEVMAPVEQWDWTPLHRFADARGLAQPRIAILGEGYAFNPPQIRYAWRPLRGWVPVMSLYEWSGGAPFDLRRTVERAAAAQIVVTAPGYRGDPSDGQTPNNRYNEAFAAALARDPRFAGPYALDVGVRRPAPVQVFVVTPLRAAGP